MTDDDKERRQGVPAGTASYDLPAAGRPPAGPPLEKIAVEEHFNFLPATVAAAGSVDLLSIVRSMDYDVGWSSRVNERLTEFALHRLGGMDGGIL